MFTRLHDTSFSWSKWRRASIADLGIPCREEIIIKNKHILRKYAIGYLEGERLTCRPKRNETAVMFLKDNEMFWFHLRNSEFLAVFGDML